MGHGWAALPGVAHTGTGSIPSHLCPSAHPACLALENIPTLLSAGQKAPGEALTAECTVNRQMSCGCAPLEKKAAQISHCFAHTHYLNCKGTKTRLEPSLETRSSSFGQPHNNEQHSEYVMAKFCLFCLSWASEASLKCWRHKNEVAKR